MGRSSRQAPGAGPSRRVRQLRAMAVAVLVVVLVAAARELVLRRDQRRFDDRYGAGT